MKPAAILTAVRLGEQVLRAKHEAIGSLWQRFGQAVRAERRARGISLKAFAIDLGYTSSTMVAMLEAGDRRWPAGKAERAVQLLKRPGAVAGCGTATLALT